MSYVNGFLAAVPAANKQKYIEHAREASEFFLANGAIRCVETWGDDVPNGKITDFYRAVQAKDDEVIVFSWVEYPDKAAYQAASDKMMTDPAMANLQMPFDGARMIWGGFETIMDLT